MGQFVNVESAEIDGNPVHSPFDAKDASMTHFEKMPQMLTPQHHQPSSQFREGRNMNQFRQENLNDFQSNSVPFYEDHNPMYNSRPITDPEPPTIPFPNAKPSVYAGNLLPIVPANLQPPVKVRSVEEKMETKRQKKHLFMNSVIKNIKKIQNENEHLVKNDKATQVNINTAIKFNN